MEMEGWSQTWRELWQGNELARPTERISLSEKGGRYERRKPGLVAKRTSAPIESGEETVANNGKRIATR
jgi:hypothetical protein